jgi:CBS-domain-containing membrane protein
LAAADVMHPEVEGFSPAVTVAELRDWFAASSSRRLAVIAEGTRYVASLTPSDLPADAEAGQPALSFASDRPVVSPDATAATARDLVTASDARRLPVVEVDGKLHGLVAVTTDRQFFACRPRPMPA